MVIAPATASPCELAPDLADAHRFVDWLDPNGAMTWQTISEHPAAVATKRVGATLGRASGDRLAGVFHGSLARNAQTLSERQRAGAGVFTMINEGDLLGRKASNVIRVRALFVDLDGAPLEPIVLDGGPHCVVESSPGRYHAYWKVKDCPLEQFSALQRALAKRFGGDTRVNDRSRVMRVPGFLHLKGEPFLTRIVEIRRHEPESIADVGERLGLSLATEEHPSHFGGLMSPSVEATLPSGPGQRNARVFDLARRLKAERPNATPAEFRPVVLDWARNAVDARTKDPAVTLNDFERAFATVKYPYGATLDRIASDLPPVPAGIETFGYGPACLKLVCLLRRLHDHQAAHHGGAPIILSVRIAADVIGVHPTAAAAMLRQVTADGVVEL